MTTLVPALAFYKIRIQHLKANNAVIFHARETTYVKHHSPLIKESV